MRYRAALLPVLFAAHLGCGDGVGHPIVFGSPSAHVSAGANGFGSGGALPGSGGIGAGGLSAGGMAAVAGGPVGSSGMGSGGGGRDGAGMGPPGPQGGDSFEPPDDADFGGRNSWDWGVGGSDGVPPGEYCEGVADWDPEDERVEQDLYQLINFARSSGNFSCEPEQGGPTQGMKVQPLAMQPELRCAARLHSLEMHDTGHIDHLNSEDEGPEARMREAGYEFRVAGETIVREDRMPPDMHMLDALSKAFADGGSDCRNLLEGSFDAVGIGVYGDLWTLDFAGP